MKSTVLGLLLLMITVPASAQLTPAFEEKAIATLAAQKIAWGDKYNWTRVGDETREKSKLARETAEMYVGTDNDDIVFHLLKVVELTLGLQDGKYALVAGDRSDPRLLADKDSEALFEKTYTCAKEAIRIGKMPPVRERPWTDKRPRGPCQ
jgi:hypothetical protein